MLRLILPLLALSSGSIFGSLYKKRYEETLPLTIMSIPVILYLFYLFNILTIGFFSVIVLIILMYGYFIYKFIKSNKEERKNILKNILTPGFLIFLLLFIAIYFITKNNKVLLWDELRLWGAYPKALFYDGSLQLGKDAILRTTMQSYEPGMPLFQYFIAKCYGIFTEAGLFFSYALIGLAPLITVTKKLTWKKWPIIPVYCVLLIVLPYVLANNTRLDGLTYYLTLFIDPMLGIYFAYTLYLTTKKEKSIFNYISFLVSLSLLVLLKDTGVLFASCAIISFILNELIVFKNYKVKRMLHIIIPIIIIVCIFGSWKLAQKIADVPNLYISISEEGEVSQFLKEPTQAQRNVISSFIAKINSDPILQSNFSKITNRLTYINLMVVLTILFVICMLLKKKQERREYGIGILMFYVCTIIFTIGLLVLYLFSLHSVQSFPRYASTIITAGIILLILNICDSIEEKKFRYYAIYLTIISIFILPIKGPGLKEAVWYDASVNADIISEQYAEKIAKNINSEKENYCIVFLKEHLSEGILIHTLYDHQIYMSLIDEGFKSPDIIYLDDIEDTREKIKKYDYAYFIVMYNDHVNKNKYSEMLGCEVKNSVLVKIDERGNFVVIE